MIQTTQIPFRVEMQAISQTFGTTRVLHAVDLRVAPGEVHALVGQNGAGKSTLMKILSGLYPEHEGVIRIDGDEVALGSPREAQRNGIGIIHQELSLVPSLTVAENILLGIEPGRLSYSRKATQAAASAVVAGVPMLAALPLNATAGSLSTGLQQRIEIAKALARNVKVLVMDEPTARLSGPERIDLGKLIRELSGAGVSIIYISHFLEEVFEYCSSLTILRNGRVISRGATSSYTMSSLTRDMLGSELAAEEYEALRSREAHLAGAPIVEFMSVTGTRISGVSFVLREGEVLGLAGLVGSGRTRIARTLAGAEPAVSGEIRLDRRAVKLRNPRSALKRGIVMLPENRKTEGLIGGASAQENMILNALDRGLSIAGIVPPGRAQALAKAKFSELEIRPHTPTLSAGRFSGGNQQKILLARALLAKPRVLIIDQPTAGVDVGTKAQIHSLIRRVTQEGTAVLIVTDDLEEMVSLADEVLVVHAGRVKSRHPRENLDRDRLVAAISD
ncbi:sugar ABC transporter ATP-binding protein [Cnuibacter sp. UC19_7]|uniref:sugar ABC transporter ATP-binding protein n=1 Tax=Cnuibacter sp. UC19_7 TaxID=3350166 RepID=UPI00366DEE32